MESAFGPAEKPPRVGVGGRWYYIRANRDGTFSIDLPIEGNLSLTVRDTNLEDFLDHFENEINEADVPADEITR